MEYEKCYTYEPENSRPAKRRKTEPQGLHQSWKLRRRAYEKAWQRQKAAIDEKLGTLNATTIDNLESFLDGAASDPRTGRIPTAVISSGADAAAHHSVVRQLRERTRAAAAAGGKQERRVFVPLSAGAAGNLKAALKVVIQRATSRAQGLEEGDEDDEEVPARGRGGAAKLLNYDLQILADFVRERGVEQVVIAFEDTEAFNSDLLSELIEIFGCWRDRVPFVFLLGIATSLDFLQQRLTRDAVRCLAGRAFDVAAPAEEVERLLDAIASPEVAVWLGPSLLASALERQGDYVLGVEGFVRAVQYGYMSCFYGNALSVFLAEGVRVGDVPADHFEAARNTESFRRYCRKQLDEGSGIGVSQLLDSDEALFMLVVGSIKKGRRALRDIRTATMMLEGLLKKLPNQSQTSGSKLYLQAMSGKLHGSTLLRSMLLSTRKAPSNVALSLLDTVANSPLRKDIQDRITSLHADLTALTATRKDTTQPLRSADDVKNSTLRTTVVSQKVELSKQKSALSTDDTAYTSLLRRFTDLLEEYFASALIDPKTLPFHEIFLYDLKSPHREAFTPRPRHALERALAAPHDYLACECCAPEQGGEEATLAATQPATAVVYQLYLESGSLINVRDLWEAFRAVMGGEEEEGEGNVALFQRALAELQYLGMLRGTRKRADHVAKVAWRGL